MGNFFVRLGREPVSKECGTVDGVWRQRLSDANASRPHPGVLTMLNPWAPAASGGSLYELLFPSVNPNAPWHRQERNSALVAKLRADVAVVLREYYMGPRRHTLRRCACPSSLVRLSTRRPARRRVPSRAPRAATTSTRSTRSWRRRPAVRTARRQRLCPPC